MHKQDKKFIELFSKKMNHQKYKWFLVSLLFFLMANADVFAILTENDKQLNKNIKTFIPVYCSTKSIPWEYWGKKYEFALSLNEEECLLPAPSSDLSNEFLGYKNKNTQLKLLCNKLDPTFGRLISSQVIETFEIDDFSKKFIFLIKDLGPQKKVEISISVARDMHNIEVTESRHYMKFFKEYKPARIFKASLNVRDASGTDTISTFSKDSVCYNLK